MLNVLENRFRENMERHAGLKWEAIEARLAKNPVKLNSLLQMEESGGEPDCVGFDSKTKEFLFVDCSAETPKGRVSACYDGEAQRSRKEHAPKSNAMDMASAMGIELLSEEEYRNLQTLGQFDLKTSSWIKTPDDIRKLGGALFCDRRYGHVFVYHNGAQSYYAVRGFRGILRV